MLIGIHHIAHAVFSDYADRVSVRVQNRLEAVSLPQVVER